MKKIFVFLIAAVFVATGCSDKQKAKKLAKACLQEEGYGNVTIVEMGDLVDSVYADDFLLSLNKEELKHELSEVKFETDMYDIIKDNPNEEVIREAEEHLAAAEMHRRKADSLQKIIDNTEVGKHNIKWTIVEFHHTNAFGAKKVGHERVFFDENIKYCAKSPGDLLYKMNHKL